MIYRDCKGTKLSMLGFGTMRLPVLENGQIDTAQTQEMVDYAMAHGGGRLSEKVPAGELLSGDQVPRPYAGGEL